MSIIYVPRTFGGTLLLTASSGQPPIPNATLLVREGTVDMTMRAGDADFVVRSGQADMVMRSGQATLYVRSGKATIEVREP